MSYTIEEEKTIGERYQVLRAVMLKRTPSEILRIDKAYELAKDAHKNQRRKTKEPYIYHPIDVAIIVANELELGANPVIAALLHDVVEDCKDYTIDDIKQQFGDDVAFLVASVTKTTQNDGKLTQVENFRKILSSANYDVRAVLVKLADRLNNMRTLDAMKREKQIKIAGETGCFFAPIANCLGIYHIKSELEDLSFSYRCSTEYNELTKLIQKEKELNAERNAEFIKRLQQCLEEVGIEAKIELIYRTAYSVKRKMKTQNRDYYHTEGKHYIRIIYPNYATINDVRYSEKEMAVKIYSVLTDKFREFPGSVKNYISSPKQNGYQSFHVKLLSEVDCQSNAYVNHWQEIHISSERMVRHARLGCVAERTERNVSDWVEKHAKMLQELAEVMTEENFQDAVNDMLRNDDIYVYTTKGGEVILPEGATALDFAFRIHTDLGLRAKFARVNGKLCSVGTKLNRGDCVMIGTTEDVIPMREWLKYAKCYKTKKELTHYYNSLPKLPYTRCEHCHPLPGDEVVLFKNKDNTMDMHKGDCEYAIARASREGDAIVKYVDSLNFEEHENIVYPVRVMVRVVDRYHLLTEIIACVTEELKLPITKIVTESEDYIGTCVIDFSVHSLSELNKAIASLNAIDGVDEVSRVDAEN